MNFNLKTDEGDYLHNFKFPDDGTIKPKGYKRTSDANKASQFSAHRARSIKKRLAGEVNVDIFEVVN